MAITNNQLTLTQLDAITVPASKQYAITNILVCNTYSPSGGSAATRGANFTMHLIPSGSALNNSVTTVVKELTLPAGETFTFDLLWKQETNLVLQHLLIKDLVIQI
jgi:hypothetical protein